MAKIMNKVTLLRKPQDGQSIKGDRGVTLRGPLDWTECANGFVFQAGGPSDTYLDYVVYNGNYYICTTSHTKSSSWVGSYWQTAAQLPFVASMLLLAKYALIKNLGVESIEMKDAAGNVVFVAKDGNVTCRTGTFNNVNIESGVISGFAFDDETKEMIAGAAGENTMLLSQNLIRFMSASGYAAVYLGANVFPSSMSGSRGALRLEVTHPGTGAASNIGAYINATGAPDSWDYDVNAGNHAIYIPKGHITGLRAKTRRISTSATLSVMDTNIICTNTSAITLTLPSAAAEDGQEYRIFSANGGKVNMSAGSGYTISGSGGSFQTAHWQVYILDKYNKKWLYSYMN